MSYQGPERHRRPRGKSPDGPRPGDPQQERGTGGYWDAGDYRNQAPTWPAAPKYQDPAAWPGATDYQDPAAHRDTELLPERRLPGRRPRAAATRTRQYPAAQATRTPQHPDAGRTRRHRTRRTAGTGRVLRTARRLPGRRTGAVPGSGRRYAATGRRPRLPGSGRPRLPGSGRRLPRRPFPGRLHRPREPRRRLPRPHGRRWPRRPRPPRRPGRVPADGLLPGPGAGHVVPARRRAPEPA